MAFFNLKDEISRLSNLPISVNPDEDDLQLPKLANKGDDHISTDETQRLGRRTLRHNSSYLLTDIDSKYSGRKSSEKAWRQTLSPETETLRPDVTEDDDISEEERNSDIEDSDIAADSSQESSEISDDEDDIDDSPESTSLTKNSEPDSSNKISEDSSSMMQFSKINTNDEIRKGQAAKTQLDLWDSIFQARIELQKMLQLSNQLPQCEKFTEFTTTFDKETQSSLNQCQESLISLLNTQQQIKEKLYSQNSETSFLCNHGSESNSEHNSPSENSDCSSDEDLKIKPGLILRQSLNDWTTLLAKEHKNFETFRNNTVDKWNQKTKLPLTKMKSFQSYERSVLEQIKQILTDKDRLIKRTQLKRTPYQVIGKPSRVSTDTNNIQQQQQVIDKNLNETDDEIFNDDDFYHQLLRELIQRKTNTANPDDPISIGRQWLAIEKLRNPMKSYVDTRASKARKIRYDIHPKLVNFMAPVSESNLFQESYSELFQSLFR